jgi:single-strand DNA-binding protein
MAGSYNKAFLVGRLGRDPELRYTQSGTPVANFPLATDESFVDGQGNRQQRTEWHRIVVWNKQAETVSNYLGKGRLVLVEGSLQTRRWQDQNGQDRQVTEIRAQRVVFMDSQSQSAGQGQQPGPSGKGGEDPFNFNSDSDNYGPAFPSEASAIDDAPF